MMRRRGSTGYHESPAQTHQMRHSLSLSKLPPRPLLHMDEEEGEASDHSYQNSDPDEEHDSHSSSSPSIEEGNEKGYQIHNNQTNANPTTPIGTERVRSIAVRSNGNRSDPELGSNSMHKRALHEAGMPISVLKGNSHSNNRNKSDTHNNNNNNNNNNNHGRRSILRTGSEGSESSALPPESMGRDDSNKSKTSALDNSSLEVRSGSAVSPTMFTNSSRITDKIRSTQLWKILRTTNPIFLLLVTGVSTMGVGLYTQSYATLSVTLDQVITNTIERQRLVEGHFQSIEKDMQLLQRKLLELHPDASLLLSNSGRDNELSSDEADATNEFLREATDTMLDEIVAVNERIRMENSKISSFEKYIQETSLRDATRKYGTGVIRVQLTLDFLSDRDKNSKPSSEVSKRNAHNSGESSQSQHVLILEMAPLELMPHSVYTFLEMIDNHLFDGCSFILNAMNILKAAPLPYEKGLLSAKQMDQNFHRLGLETVSFREYNNAFPHEQYTVGFAADGSPDFYINLGDNTEEHTGEPCFARIVSGFETIKKMEAEPLRSGMWIKKRIGIKKATVL